ncbi:MAG: hypothetical protein ACL93V_14050 [Candidatus Electrothrix sp. YB6]
MNSRKNYMPAVRNGVICAVVLAGLTGCGVKRVVMSENDLTAPAIHWDILHQDSGEHEIISGENEQTAVQEAKVYPMFCRADDPEGVKRVEMKITAKLFCQRNTADPSSADYYRHKDKVHTVVLEKGYEADEKKTVPVSGFVTTDLNGDNWKGIDCLQGYTSSTVQNYTMTCTAWNWSDQSATRSLEVKNSAVFE